jgi:ABC-type branched-subunit amino acid transport system ATPase component
MATGEAAPALLLDSVVKTYGAIRAVDGVSFKASAGEFIALLGPNGAGKTTLFQLLSGLFVPDSGRIEVMGHDTALRRGLDEAKVTKADFEVALTESRASVTAEMLEEYEQIQATLKSEATRPLGGIGFVLPGMLQPKPGGKP